MEFIVADSCSLILLAKCGLLGILSGEDSRERLLSQYQAGELSAIEVCKMLNITPWEIFDILKKKNITLNVTLEDWLDSMKLA